VEYGWRFIHQSPFRNPTEPLGGNGGHNQGGLDCSTLVRTPCTDGFGINPKFTDVSEPIDVVTQNGNLANVLSLSVLGCQPDA